MLLKIAVALSCFVYIWGLELGDTCVMKDNTAGTCKAIDDCPFVIKQLQNNIKPATCKWMGKTRIVCCPDKSVGEIGELRTSYGGTQKGILQGLMV